MVVADDAPLDRSLPIVESIDEPEIFRDASEDALS